MENRKHIGMRIRPDINFYGKQVAKFRNRPFSNLIEYLLSQEIEKARAEGFEFEKYVPEGGEVDGTPGEKDNALDDVFKQFAGD